MMEIFDSLEDTVNNNNNSNKVKCEEKNGYCYVKIGDYNLENSDRIVQFKIDYCALTSLDLSASQLSSIPIEINDLKNLSYLNVTRNHIAAINECVVRSTSLSVLIAAFNQLVINQALIDKLIDSFPSLAKLNLCYQEYNNQLNENHKCNQLNLNNCGVQYFNISGNQLNQLSSINGNQRLNSLILHSNGMQSLPLLRSCQQLLVLDVSNNCFDDKLLTGKHLDILFNNCPSLKHLDMISSGSSGSGVRFNARNAINESQYLTPINGDKLIHFVDIGSVNNCQIAVSNSFNSSTVCVEKLSESEFVLGLINGSQYSSAVKSHFSGIIESEMGCVETRKDYLKNSVFACFKIISDRSACDSLANVNIIVAHVIFDQNGGNLTVKVCTCGHSTTLRHVSMETDNAKPLVVNLLCSTKLYNTITHKNGTKDSVSSISSSSLIADPICHELALNPRDSISALLMGINIADHDEEGIAKLFATSSSPALDDKLKRYGEVINARNYVNNSSNSSDRRNGLSSIAAANNNANFLAIAIQMKLIEENNRCDDSRSSSSNTSSPTNDSEHSEKYRSWEYILEENHKCLFSKELESLKDVDSDKLNSVSSRNGKASSHPSIISLQQFMTKADKINKKIDLNTFKVYKI